ncbi:hypothetical protein GHT06_010957 [Daphnia sinensis]|uniref:Uncharacterized protein n=1 Tax=Daphnia sinensis TaxID=1820382 RepID=A0AAD5KZ54_9CRUS|nr:hypothetical protein GHT06_010957 [Daphnia sinensis]
MRSLSAVLIPPSEMDVNNEGDAGSWSFVRIVRRPMDAEKTRQNVTSYCLTNQNSSHHSLAICTVYRKG